MAFEERILDNNPDALRRILAVLDAALQAVRPDVAVRRQLERSGNNLSIAGQVYDLTRFRRVFVVGAGKAGAPMAQAVEAVLGDAIAVGLVVVKYGHSSPTQRIEIVEAGHPLPDAAGLAAGVRMLELAADAGEDDLVIVLLSGGGSALLEATAGIGIEDLQAMTSLLLACGATIGEINCLRKHASRVKGGQLARAFHPATVVTLVLSDVVGSPLDVIASGPTTPDTTTWSDVWAILEKYELADKLPVELANRYRAGLAGDIADTPKPGDAIFAQAQITIVGDNRIAANAARTCAQRLEYNTLLLSSFVEGEAREVAKVVAALAKEIVASGNPVPPPACLIFGGETTVTLHNLRRAERPGIGGRNQELALAAALEIDGLDEVAVVALATDGSDGPTDAAGGLVDGGTVVRGRSLGLYAAEALRRHDAYPFLHSVGDLLICGPTQTNVNDLIVVFVEDRLRKV